MAHSLEILGLSNILIDRIPTHALSDFIENLYKLQARYLHPDKNPNDPQTTQKFQEIQSAFSTIKQSDLTSLVDKLKTSQSGLNRLALIDAQTNEEELAKAKKHNALLLQKLKRAELEIQKSKETNERFKQKTIEEHFVYSAQNTSTIEKSDNNSELHLSKVIDKFWLQIDQKPEVFNQYDEQLPVYIYLNQNLRPIVGRYIDKKRIAPYGEDIRFFIHKANEFLFVGSLDQDSFQTSETVFSQKIWDINSFSALFPHIHPTIAINRHLVFLSIKEEYINSSSLKSIEYYVTAPLIQLLPFHSSSHKDSAAAGSIHFNTPQGLTCRLSEDQVL